MPEKKRLRLSASIKQEAKYYTGLPRPNMSLVAINHFLSGKLLSAVQSRDFLISICLCSINSWLQRAPVDILIYTPVCADIQVAIRNTQQGVFYFTDQIPLTALMVEDGRIEPAAFVQSWKNLPEANESQKELPISITSLDMVKSKIEAANIFLMAHKQVIPQSTASGCLFAQLCCNRLYRYDMRLLAN